MNAELTLSNHFEVNVVGLQRFEDRLDTIFQDHKGIVYVVLEHSRADPANARRFEDLVNSESITPTNAHFIAKLGDGSRHTTLELEVLDRYFLRYRDPRNTYQSRLRVLCEKDVADTTEEQNTLQPYSFIYIYLELGQFDQALNLFKAHTKTFARRIVRREEAIVKSITQLADESVDYVVVKFGTAHTSLRRRLSEQNIPTKVTLLDRDESERTYWFSPRDALIRKMMFSNNICNLSDIEFYRAMLGDIAEQAMRGVLGINEEDLSSEIIKTLYSFSCSFNTLEDVERFKNLVISTNLYNALEQWKG